MSGSAVLVLIIFLKKTSIMSYRTAMLDVVDCFFSRKPIPYITHNATEPLSDTAGNSSEYMQLPLEPQKTLYYFHICSSTPVNKL